MERLYPQHRKRSAARKQTRGARAGGKLEVLFQHAAEPDLFALFDFRERNEIAMNYLVGFAAQHVGKAASHARPEIQAERTKDEHDTAGHVFAAVLADSFDDGERAAIANGKTLASAAGHEEPARSGAVKNRVSGEHVAAARGGGTGSYRDRSA